MQQIYYKKNELFEVEFYKDKECTEAFDFKNAQNLYIDGLNGDTTPLYEAYNRLGVRSFTIYTPYISAKYFLNGLRFIGEVKTLDNITPNLSKYIPEDNAVLFLSEEEYKQQRNAVSNFKIKTLNQDFRNVLFFYDGVMQETNTGHINLHYTSTKKITIFLTHGTRSELQKANEVAKELMEKYGVEEVNWFALHCFSQYIDASNAQYTADLGFINQWSINKIITTNSTGILKPEDSNERLQIIDVKEIFEECGEIVKNNP